jgi:O-antigen/teichoic acid export membrane protein
MALKKLVPYSDRTAGQWIPLWTGSIRPRLTGTRDYANNLSVEMVLNGLGLVSGILLARWLGPTGRGQLSAAMLWPGVIGILISLGLQHAFVYAVGAGWATPERLQRLALKFTLVVAVPAMVLYWSTASWILGKQFPNHEWIPGIFSLYIPLAIYGGLLFPIYQGSGDFKHWNIARVFRSGAWTVAVVVLAIAASLTVLNLLLAQIVILIILGIYLYSKLAQLKGRNKGDGSAPLSRIFKYGFAVYFSGLAYTVNQQLDQLLLSIWVIPADLGQYAAAATLSGVLLVIPAALGPIGFSKIARATGEQAEQRRHVHLAVMCTALVLVPAGLLLMIAAPLATRILFGSAYVQTAQLLRILAPASIFLGTSVMLADVLRGMGKPMYGTYGAVVGSVVTIVGLSLLLPRFGIWGAAWVSLTAYTAMMLIQCWFLWRCMTRREQLSPTVAVTQLGIIND